MNAAALATAAQDLGAVPHLLAAAVTRDVVWNDPKDSFIGIHELEAAVLRLRTAKPDYRFEIVSEIDHHHGILRYRWQMKRRDRTLIDGLDIVTVEPGSGLITRVDGFFGEPTLIAHDGSGVPFELRAAPANA